jgi:hypothetical protein
MELIILIKDLKLPKDTSDTDIVTAYRKASDNIMNAIEGYDTFSHTNGTDVININAKWKGKQITTNLDKIIENQYVRNFLIFQDPLHELEEAVKYHDILKAYPLGCTLFESFGVKILKEHFDINNVHVGIERIDRIGLQNVLVMLYTHKIITKSEYDDMININSIRNKLIIHKDITKPFDVDTLVSTTEHIDKILTYADKLKMIFWRAMSIH